MNNKQKGFAVPFLVVLVIILAGGLVYFATQNNNQETSNNLGGSSLVETNAFTIELPSGWEFNSLQGTDSYVGEFTGDGVTLRFDYGRYSNSLTEDNDPDHIVTYENIDGYQAKLVTPNNTGNGITGVFIGDVQAQTGTARFNLVGQDLNNSQQAVALQIFNTLHFTQ